MNTNATLTTDDWGFGLRDEFELTDWLAVTPEEFGEYIHVVYDDDERALRLYRTVGETGANERVLTVLDDVHLRTHDDVANERSIEHWFLTWGEANTLITWLTALNRERSPARLSMEYYPESGKAMYEDLPIGEELLTFEYTTDSGRNRWISITSTYRNEIQMLASFE